MMPGCFVKSSRAGTACSLRVVVVLDGLDPGGTEEEEVADILGGMDVGCLAVDAVEAADENAVGVRHLRGAVDG